MYHPRLLLSCAVTLLILGMTPSSTRAGLIFNLREYTLSNGYSIDSGTIEVTDNATADGQLTVSEITRVIVHYTSPAGAQVLDTTQANTACYISGTLSISNSQIFVVDPIASVNQLNVLDTKGTGGSTTDDDKANWGAQIVSQGVQRFVIARDGDQSPVDGSAEYSTSPLVIADAVPEPSCLVLVGLGVLAMAGHRWRQRRRARA